MGHAGKAASTLIAQVTKKADQFSVRCRQGSDVIELVVCIGTGEGLAARDGLVAVLWHNHLDPVDIAGIDDSRHVEVGLLSKPVEANFSEHARLILGSLRNRVPVANPSSRKGGFSCTQSWDDEWHNFLERSLRGEDDGSLSVVLVDEVDRVGSNEGGKRSSCEEGSGELHFDKSSVDMMEPGKDCCMIEVYSVKLVDLMRSEEIGWRRSI